MTGIPTIKKEGYQQLRKNNLWEHKITKKNKIEAPLSVEIFGNETNMDIETFCIVNGLLAEKM